MGECEDPSDVDKGQTVMAGRPRQSVSKTAGLMEGVCVWGGGFPGCSGLVPNKMVRGRRTGDPATGSWAPEAH